MLYEKYNIYIRARTCACVSVRFVTRDHSYAHTMFCARKGEENRGRDGFWETEKSRTFFFLFYETCIFNFSIDLDYVTFRVNRTRVYRFYNKRFAGRY